MTTTINTDISERLDEVFSHFTNDSSNLIPILQETQEILGYLPVKAMLKIADFLGVSESSVFGVATFYAQFRLTPVGRKVVKICRGTACHVRGADQLREEVERQLGIKPGEVTDDLEYSLETIACFGSCALAPVMVVNETVYGRVTTKMVKEILSDTK
jgi:NADH:ubiquinone oxidoreductase subunit E